MSRRIWTPGAGTIAATTTTEWESGVKARLLPVAVAGCLAIAATMSFAQDDKAQNSDKSLKEHATEIGAKVKSDAKEAAAVIKKDSKEAGQAIARGAKATGEAVKRETKAAGAAIKSGSKKVGTAVKQDATKVKEAVSGKGDGKDPG